MQVQYVLNSCDSVLDPSGRIFYSDSMLNGVRDLRTRAYKAEQEFVKYKGYGDVGGLGPKDNIRSVGMELLSRLVV